MSSMSPASEASSPASEGTPRPLAPLAPIATNGLPSNPSSSQHPVPSLLTHKEWIIPPRPKPGRKPATDTPPTKRKAQNRAAQRAFRERRAAKVGELEEQMKEMEEEDEREQNELRGQIHRLEAEVKDYERVVHDYGQRMRVLEQELADERSARVSVQRDLARSNGQHVPIDVVPLPPRKRLNDKSQLPIRPYPQPDPFEETAMGCGNCTTDTRCECIEQAFNMTNIAVENSATLPKRPRSPTGQDNSKRLRQSLSVDVKPEQGNEIDFTTRLPPIQPSRTMSHHSHTPSSRMIDGCGFCQDGTACLCAELAEDAKNASTDGPNLSRLFSQRPDHSRYSSPTSLPGPNHPHPHSTSLSSESRDPCQNGPGTCTQCQTSPTSTLFCKSLAATRCDRRNASSPAPIQSPPKPAPCNNPHGCCRAPVPPVAVAAAAATVHPVVLPHPFQTAQLSPPASASPISGPTLSCADAFTTLSRHPHFDRASDELGTWLPRLTTVPKGVEGRTAFEIEAASVMGVIKLFDRRFGRGD
ncbi:hypothetical protein MMC19_003475 [Ptychographa xylographoides]|nr:hypothetical protein [Ptychographa xylographoides]